MSSSPPTISAVRSEPLRRRHRPIVSPSLDKHNSDVTGSLPRNPLVSPPPRYQASDFPKVDRTLKGDRLVVRPAEPAGSRRSGWRRPLEDPSTSNASVMGAKTATAPLPAERAPLDPELQAALNAPPLPQYDLSLSLETKRGTI